MWAGGSASRPYLFREGIGVRNAWRLIMVTVCVLGAGAGFSSAPALALDTHAFSLSFGSGGPEAGQLALTANSGVAVDDATHDVYVADTGNVRVDEFESDGTFIRAWGWGVADGLPLLETCTLSCQAGIPGSSPGQFEVPVFVAVDNSSDSSQGDVYIGDDGTNVVQKFTESGALIESWGVKGEISETPTGEEGALVPLGGIAGLTVGPSGTLDVLEGSSPRLFEFSQDGTFTTDLEASQRRSSEAGLAVNTAGDFFKINREPSVEEFGPSGVDVGQVSASAESTGLGLDSADGDLYVDDNGVTIDHYAFDASGNVIEPDGSPCVVAPELGCKPTNAFTAESLSGGAGLAVDSPNDTVYVANSAEDVIDAFDQVVLPDVTTGETTNLDIEGSAALNGTVNPDGLPLTSCEFEYVTETAFEEEGYNSLSSGGTVSCVPSASEIPADSMEHPVEATVSGLVPLTTYRYRLVAGNRSGTNPGANGTFIAAARPTVDEESVADVASSSATLNATLNAGGVDATYRFEYGTSRAYGANAPSPPGDAGSSASETTVGTHIQDLRPDTTYHYRVIVSNPVQEDVAGLDQTFTTQTAGSAFALPDNRAWELVSPPDKHGATIEAITREGGLRQASEDGGAISYVANAPIEAEPEGNPARELTQVLSERRPEGWVAQDIATPHDAATGVQAGNPAEYKLFSSDLSSALVEQVGDDETPLSPLSEGAEKTVYVRDDASNSYLPLITADNVPPDTQFGDQVSFVSATPDLSHVVLSSNVALTTTPAAHGGLYEWTDGTLQLVSVLHDNEPATGPTLGESNADVRNAISDDGAQVVWAAEKHLYLRDVTKGETTQLDADQGGLPSGGEPHEAQFQTASSEGSRVFFTDAERLTADSTASGEESPTEPDLYEFDLASGKLTDLTVDHNSGERADVQGVILGAGEDGSDSYFVARGVLTDVENGEKERALSGEDNLYAVHYNGTAWEEPSFIATLSNNDGPDWNGEKGSLEHDLGELTTRVSPNGRYLAFMSERSLTGYDNVDAGSQVGDPHSDEEVYLYEASSKRLVCASCNSSGARPAGVFDTGEFPGLLVDRPEIWGGRWLAGSIPGWTSVDLTHALYQSRYLSDSGRLFFDSADSLVPQDENGVEDVYEWEPSGVGDCTMQSMSFSERSGGCVALISSGSSAEESAFLDASENGSDVFFLTSASLVQQDGDDSFDIYDAHECTEASPCVTAGPVSPPSCDSEGSCRPAPSQQPAIFGPPATATLLGGSTLADTAHPKSTVAPAGLTRAQKLAKALKACRRMPKKTRTACESKARKKYDVKRGRQRKSSSKRLKKERR